MFNNKSPRNPDQSPTGIPAGDIVIETQYEMDPSLQEVMCLLKDGRLLVSKSHTLKPNVSAFQARLVRLKVKFNVVTVDMAVITRVWAGARNKKGGNTSDFQSKAAELFQRAVKKHASDIHISVSKREKTVIEFRIHGDIIQQQEETFEYGQQLCTTIYQAMCDVSDPTFEMLSSQDARISDKSKIPAGIDGIRVATSPQVDGITMVMRLLYDDTSNSLDPISLGYTFEQGENLALLKKNPKGIIIIAGGTGSGKSTTLQRLLVSIIREFNRRKRIITVEDPPEYPINGAWQTAVTNVADETDRSKAFQDAIRSALRRDPDVIMIGEARDAPSAHLAIEAAMTGHQVWTTLHANSAFAIIERLIDLGIPIELVCDPEILTGLVCQALIKVLCPQCKVCLSDLNVQSRYKDADLKRVMKLYDIEKVFVCGSGCDHCDSGVKGRTVVAEIVITTEELMDHVRRKDRVGAIKHWREQMRGLGMKDHAMLKIKSGIVDPFQAEEVLGPIGIEGRV